MATLSFLDFPGMNYLPDSDFIYSTLFFILSINIKNFP